MILALFAHARAPVASPAPREGTGPDLFESNPVWRIQFEVPPQSMESLRSRPRKYVPATVRIDGQVVREAGVQLKGSGSFQPVDEKPSLTVNFERFVPGQRLLGLEKIHLNNSIQDPTCLQEFVGTELFRASGVPVPRVAHAVVELNGRRLGLYVVREGFTEDFLRRHFGPGDGCLYEPDRGDDIVAAVKRRQGSDAEAALTNALRSRRGHEAERSLAMGGPPPNVGGYDEADLGARWNELRRTLDLERLVTLMAMEVLTCHWDGYCLGPNNVRFFHSAASGRWTVLPSGMDQLFGKADFPWNPQMAGLLARAVLELPDGRALYRARLEALSREVFRGVELTDRLRERWAQIRPFLLPEEARSMEGPISDLCVRILERERFLAGQRFGFELEEGRPAFKDGMLPLSGWRAFDEPAGGEMRIEESAPGGKLHSVAGARSSGSWRTKVRLPRGRYAFDGVCRVAGVTPLPFGSHHGASLRVAGGAARSRPVMGTSGRERLRVEFEVTEAAAEVMLICELRASSGEAWFEIDSLKVTRRQEPSVAARSPECD
jgi:hypothetical protein